jgi:hypothetical protein
MKALMLMIGGVMPPPEEAMASTAALTSFPLVEQGLAEQLSISHSIYPSERMLPVKEIAAALCD